MKNILDDKILRKKTLAQKVVFSILQCKENDGTAIEKAIQNHSLKDLKVDHEDIRKILPYIPEKKLDEIFVILSAFLNKPM